jgi:hypothetical protein
VYVYMRVGVLTTTRRIRAEWVRTPYRSVGRRHTELLGSFQWFGDHAFRFFVVTNIDVTGSWEVLTEWVSFESVVGQQTASVRVSGEAHPKSVPRFAFSPVGRGVSSRGRRDRRVFVREHVYRSTEGQANA